ncbi:MAG: helicase [Sulfobacillus benefaciens]|uniref:Helicase n=1 Tax=Sulfobacillus benefaciens TaxID=453960 RepID=A0A2T2XHA9_9FIRM|nr:MAG: helicase [Sulfobacillus benefaciens]
MEWVYLRGARQRGRVVQRETVFGEAFAHVWIPETGTVVRVATDEIEDLPTLDLAETRYRAYASRIVQALPGDVLLAPLDSRVAPLPHQIQVLDRVVRERRMRLLLADEVGLGKTIEAGLVIRELKLRRKIRRILVVAPKGLLHQWASELALHFGELFRVITGDDLRGGHHEVWSQNEQLIVSQDGIKPLARRRGWEAERIAEYNRQRYEAVLGAGWDLIVIDEAHRLGGSTDTVARFRLGQGLAAAAPYLLLLTATPHQGKTDQFRRLLSLLDAERFIENHSLSPGLVQPYVMRTAKRMAVNADGLPLFQSRRVEMVVVDWDPPRYAMQRKLYEAVTSYVQKGYRQAVAEKAYTETFLLILMQRMVTSSPSAVERALRRRIMTIEDREATDNWEVSEDDEIETAIDETVPSRDHSALVSLLELASLAVQSPDARVDRLIALIDKIRREETSDTKFLIFTEFLPTQSMLARVLTGYGYRVSVLNGQMDMGERLSVQEAFRHHSQFLISTDAGGEGLNLQFAHVVINYDLPWNPMRIEQRIGRVDRIGQRHMVRAFNFVIADTVEYRVHEVLLEKLQRILEELGIDKLGDVLDSTGLDVDYQGLYVSALIDPERADSKLSQWVEEVRETADQSIKLNQSIEAGPPDPNRLKTILHHPLPSWMASMVEHYVAARGGSIQRTILGWTIAFPDGMVLQDVIFRPDSEGAGQTYLALDHPEIQRMLEQLPHEVQGSSLSRLVSDAFPKGLRGLWSLWEMTLRYGEDKDRRILPLFLSQDGRVFRASSLQIWEQLTHPSFKGDVVGTSRQLDEMTWNKLFEHAQKEAEPLYQELKAAHSERVRDERIAMEQAFKVRREIIERVGLPNVREARMRRLESEYAKRLQKIADASTISPQLQPLLILEVDAS